MSQRYERWIRAVEASSAAHHELLQAARAARDRGTPADKVRSEPTVQAAQEALETAWQELNSAWTERDK